MGEEKEMQKNNIGEGLTTEENRQLIREFDSIFSVLREKDRKYLHQILEVFCSEEGHMTVDELVTRVRKRKNIYASHDDVKNLLRLFVKYGIASELKIEGKPVRYEHRHLGKQHDHFICVKCGKIQESVDDELEKALAHSARKNRFLPFHHKLQFYGLCEDCKSRKEGMYPLSFAENGEIGVVTEIRGGKMLRNRLRNLGITEGTVIEVIYNTGNVIVAVKDTRIAVGFGMAQKIMFRPKVCEQ